ncbi:transport and Golgi organization protein 6 [Uranotaenia lowii]|uniref:transport and Golgi organization protein 6 n=1 Tax=Uranotaenia lowii TaxID=190385 RepID=UPI002479D779|nr:transport and Golgi organization protein 6 [Uranotaenia lowii]
MDKTVIRRVISDLSEAKPADLNLNRLQSIIGAAQAQISSQSEVVDPDPLWSTSAAYLLVQHQFLTTCLVQKKVFADNPLNPTQEEDVVSLQELDQFFRATDVIRQFTLNLYLPKELRSLTKCDLKLVVVNLDHQEQIRRLTFCLEAFLKLFMVKFAVVDKRMENSILDYIAGVFELHYLKNSIQDLPNDPLFQNFDLFSTEILFKSLLIIKGKPDLPTDLAKQIHLELLRRTGLKGGFPVLCKTLLVNVPSDETPVWQKSKVIAKIVGCKGHTKNFYRQVLQDCFEFNEASLQKNNEESLNFASTCIECCKQIYQLPPAYAELRKTIETYFVSRFDLLHQPTELLSGTIILEQSQLAADIYLNYMAFSGSSCSSLNSSILIPYLQIFLKLTTLLPSQISERKQLNHLIIFCLANREKSELETVLSDLLFETSSSSQMRKFHPRIVVKKEPNNDETYSILVGSTKGAGIPSEVGVDGEMQSSSLDDQEDSTIPVMVEVLKDSNRNLLIYDVFLVLLKLVERISANSPKTLLLDPEEREAIDCKQFYRKYVLINALMELISHKHFHSQLYDNPSEMLAFLEGLLKSNTEQRQPNEDLLALVLSIFQEYLQRLQSRSDVQRIVILLQKFQSSDTCSEQLRSQIEQIFVRSSPDLDEETPYRNALSLCSDREAYCKVYGTTLMIKLLQTRDKETVTNKHAILVLALNNLRNVESYAFLNSVRLLVALCDVLESDTIETLIKEFNSVGNEVDFRLKIGEALVKTVETLGPIAYNYKEQLINCFINGSKSLTDEIRSSSLSNLGNICKILSYQVHHFFYEMFLVIKSAIETDTYLPVRRAAILIFSQLIEGIDNLLSFDTYLLPMYRFLKHIIATEKDDVTRLQAAVALDHLSAKTKDLLTSLQTTKLEKEIRIFGIKDHQ